MCGIVGYVGKRQAAALLLEGLQRLEYRGYDSAGLAVIGTDGRVHVERAVGKLNALTGQVHKRSLRGTVGIGHTRWATHGKPSVDNAHPHRDCSGSIMVVHNGIVENYLTLKAQLMDTGHRFLSQTDTEVVPHLIETYLKNGQTLEGAVRLATAQLQGSHALVILSIHDGHKLIAVRIGNAGGITVGYGEGEMFAASDLPALLPHTRTVVFLNSGEMAALTEDRAEYWNLQGEPLQKQAQRLSYEPLAASKGVYKHFMLKEIMEQPAAVLNAFRGQVAFDTPDVDFKDMPFSAAEIRGFRRAVLVGMGTSLHAAMIGRTYIEQLAKLPAEVDNASEFRYRDPLVGPETLVVSVTQSGETVDTLMSMEEAKRKGAKQIVICNVPGSQATRLADYTIPMLAGLEIGVASTKTLCASITLLYLLALYAAKVRGAIEPSVLELRINDLAKLPHAMGRTLERSDQYESLAHAYFRCPNFLYLGRGLNYPVAMEGALKLKEISYIHAEGYPAGEMKHGPIALIDENMPVVALATKDSFYDKMINTIEQVRARDGKVIAIATDGNRELETKAQHVLFVPEVSPLLSPLVNLIPLQLFSYYIALRRGCDVDQPRNLAKSVTVE